MQSGTTMPTFFASPIAPNLHPEIPTPPAAATPSEMAARPPPPWPRPGSGCRPCEVRILVPPRPRSGRPWTGGAGSPSPGAPWRCLRRRPCPGGGPVAVGPSFWCRYCIDRLSGSEDRVGLVGHGNFIYGCREFGAGTTDQPRSVCVPSVPLKNPAPQKPFYGGWS